MNITKRDILTLSHSAYRQLLPVYQAEQRAIELLQTSCFRVGVNSGVYGFNFAVYLNPGKTPCLFVVGPRCPTGYKYLYFGDVKEVLEHGKTLFY